MDSTAVMEMLNRAIRERLWIDMIPRESLRPGDGRNAGSVHTRGMACAVAFTYRGGKEPAVRVGAGEGCSARFPVPGAPDKLWADHVARKVVEYVRTEQRRGQR
jgi:hypothetical protein